MTVNELLAKWKAEDARFDRQIEIDLGGGDFVSRRAHVEQLRLLRERTTALETSLGSQRWLSNIDPRNHHNALTCPYCNPEGLVLALPPAPPQEQELERLRAERDGARLVARQMQDRLADCQQQLAASPPAQKQDAIKDERDWIRTKFKIPLDAPVGDVYGKMHVLEAHAHGYVTYIEAFKCDDKQGEIARLTVENAALRDKLSALPPAHGWHAEKEQQ